MGILRTQNLQLDDKWAPLPIERPDEYLNSVTDQLAQLREAISKDNGYAASEPSEREEVVYRLKVGIDYLNSASIVIYTAVDVYVVWPVKQILARFTTATIIGKAATLAISVVTEWLKNRGVQFLDDLFK
jgi:hypothetical protein